MMKKAEHKTLLSLEEHMRELRHLRDVAKANGQLSAATQAEVRRGELRKFDVKQVEHGDVVDFSRMSDAELEGMLASWRN
jgi:hypothetical protein